MDIPTIPGAVYSIASSTSCDVTDKASGKPLGTATPGSPVTTPAYSDALTLSDPGALYVQIKTFNFALAALGLLGGGASAVPDVLPAGYIEAAFLEGKGGQYIDTLYVPNNETGARLVLETTITSYRDAMPLGCSNIYDHFCVPRPQPAVGYAWGLWVSLLSDRKAYLPGVNVSELNYLNSRKAKIATLEADLTNTLPTLGKSLYFFDSNGYRVGWIGRIFTGSLSQLNDIVKDYSPAIDPQGAPCFFEKVTKQPFYNSGSGAFIVGLTLKQALKLSKLPVTGGTLTVSLPTGYDADAGVMSALETARANGWTLTIQTYEAELAAATFGMRRIWVRRQQDEQGAYVDADGTRWRVDWCVDVLTPDGSTPDAHGYELFRSQDAAVEYWELTPYVDPESQNLLTETNENE